MRCRKSGVLCLMAALAVVLSGAAAQALDMEMVYVGNAGNAAWTGNSAGAFGAGDYAYNIGKYEVTIGQYTEFLNAVAKTDAYGLYVYTAMGDIDDFHPNIMQDGSSGNYSYSVDSQWANRPMQFVSWGSAARFANWLHNGQPTTGSQTSSTTEDGAYTLNGAITNDEYAAVTRNAGAKYFLPTANEWFKAAYHKNDGATGNYWQYPTASNNTPSGTISNPDSGNTVTVTGTDPMYNTTIVGEHEFSDSAYGTYDQGGNVAEWTEGTRLADARRLCMGENYRGTVPSDTHINAGYVANYYVWPSVNNIGCGFRVAAAVPEPGTIAMLLMGAFGLALFAWKRR